MNTLGPVISVQIFQVRILIIQVSLYDKVLAFWYHNITKCMEYAGVLHD